MFEAFSKISAKQWHEKIRADLRERSPEDMYWSFDESLDVNPFVHADDLRGFTTSVPFTGSWEVAEQFKVDDPGRSNAGILEALNGGCETILLYFDSLPDWAGTLRDVHPGYLTTVLNPGAVLDAGDVAETFNQFLNSQDLQPQPLWYVRTDKGDAPDCRRCIHVASQPDIIAGLAGAMQTVAGSPGAQFDFVCDVGTGYFVEIARLRALALLHFNIQSALGVPDPAMAFIEAHCNVAQTIQDPYQNMIRSGTAALAAFCGGARRIVIAPVSSDDAKQSFYRHVARNVHHILRYESKLERSRDPVQGAYAIEQLTKRLVTNTWSLLIEDLEKGGR